MRRINRNGKKLTESGESGKRKLIEESVMERRINKKQKLIRKHEITVNL